jgi:hypothetical protein
LAGIADNFNRHQTLAEKDRPGIELIVAFADTAKVTMAESPGCKFYLSGHERARTII